MTTSTPPPLSPTAGNTGDWGRGLGEPDTSHPPPSPSPRAPLQGDTLLTLANSGSDGPPVKRETPKKPASIGDMSSNTGDEQESQGQAVGAASCLSWLTCFLPTCCIACLDALCSYIGSCFRTLFCCCCSDGELFSARFTEIANNAAINLPNNVCQQYARLQFASTQGPLEPPGVSTMTWWDPHPSSATEHSPQDVLLESLKRAHHHTSLAANSSLTGFTFDTVFIYPTSAGKFHARYLSYTQESPAEEADPEVCEGEEGIIRRWAQGKNLILPDNFFSDAAKLRSRSTHLQNEENS